MSPPRSTPAARGRRAALAAVLLGALAVGPAARADGGISAEERAVLSEAARVTRGLGAESHVWIVDRTATFECGPIRSVVSIGGCSGMRSADETPEQALARVARSIRGVDPQAVRDLLAKSRESVAVEAPLAIPADQRIWSSGPVEVGDDAPAAPELALSVSRVGFDAARTRALAYLGAMDWKDARRSFGEYVYLVKRGSGWRVEGRTRVWQLAY